VGVKVALAYYVHITGRLKLRMLVLGGWLMDQRQEIVFLLLVGMRWIRSLVFGLQNIFGCEKFERNLKMCFESISELKSKYTRRKRVNIKNRKASVIEAFAIRAGLVFEVGIGSLHSL
jgi:hypothetical protein